MPLLYFHVKETLGRAGHLKSELKSFTLLLQIHYELDRRKRSKPMYTDLLKKLQVEHQHAFCTCYGQDKMKPKHHQRLHLADQMASQKIYVDCFPCEKQHRAYKTYVGTGRFDMFASGVRNEQSQFSKLNLENMFLYHIHSLHRQPRMKRLCRSQFNSKDKFLPWQQQLLLEERQLQWVICFWRQHLDASKAFLPTML